MQTVQSNSKRFKTISIEKLTRAHWNYKTDDEFMQKRLVENIKRNGQVENLLVRQLGDGSYEVVNGNHRYMAMKELGYDKVVVCDLTPMTEEQAKRIAIETNETRFDSDPMLLASMVSDTFEHFDDFADTIPFTDDQVDGFDSMLTNDNSEIVDTAPTMQSKTKTVLSVGGEDYKIVKLELSADVADRFTAQVNRLQSLLGFSSSNHPADFICETLEAMPDEDIKPREAKQAKKSSKKSRKK